jgi:MFS family permease
LPLGRLSDRFDRRQVLIAVAISSALISLVMVLLQPRAPELVTALAIAYGAVTFPMYALLVAHANDYASPGDFVRVSSGLLFLYGVGAMIGPVLGAVGMDRLSPEGLFAFTGVIDAAIIAYTFYRMGQRPPQSRREPFQAIPQPRSVTPESAVLDPRANEPPVSAPVAPAEARVGGPL